MSEFNGRRAPNFSQYLEDLNAIPSPYDQALQQQQQQQDSFNLDSELSLFTNAEFFDFDKFGDLSLPTFDSMDNDKSKEDTNEKDQNSDLKFLEFLNEGLGNMNDFSSSDFNNNNNVATTNDQSLSIQSTPFTDASSGPNGLPNTDTTALPSQSSPISAPQSAAPAQTPASNPKSVSKRKPTHKPTPLSVEEAAQVNADEDKRRRNTAASARFRVKKKLREQTLEKSVKETTDKNTALEARVTALELENQWLKNLITEKNGRTPEEGKTSQNDIASMFKKFLATQQASRSQTTGTSS